MKLADQPPVDRRLDVVPRPIGHEPTSEDWPDQDRSLAPQSRSVQLSSPVSVAPSANRWPGQASALVATLVHTHWQRSMRDPCGAVLGQGVASPISPRLWQQPNGCGSPWNRWPFQTADSLVQPGMSELDTAPPRAEPNGSAGLQRRLIAGLREQDSLGL